MHTSSLHRQDTHPCQLAAHTGKCPPNAVPEDQLASRLPVPGTRPGYPTATMHCNNTWLLLYHLNEPYHLNYRPCLPCLPCMPTCPPVAPPHAARPPPLLCPAPPPPSVTPQRYIQWLVTTPTMVYILSKISDFTPRQTFTAIALDVIMVVFGLMASFMPWPFNCE